MVKISQEEQVGVPLDKRGDIEKGEQVATPEENNQSTNPQRSRDRMDFQYASWTSSMRSLPHRARNNVVLSSLSVLAVFLLIIGLSVGLIKRNEKEVQSASASDQLGKFGDFDKLLIVGGDILTMNPKMEVLSNGAIFVKSGVIEDLGDADALRAKYTPDFTIELEEHDIVFPGLINSHGHVCMTAFGDLVDDRELNDWLYNYIFPLEGALVTEEFCASAVMLGMAEMLQGGTTTFVDAYFFQDEMAHLITENVRMRAVLCEGVIDFAQPDFQTPNETFAYIETFLQNWNGSAFVTPCIIPHAPYTTSPWIYKKSVALVEK